MIRGIQSEYTGNSPRSTELLPNTGLVTTLYLWLLPDSSVGLLYACCIAFYILLTHYLYNYSCSHDTWNILKLIRQWYFVNSKCWLLEKFYDFKTPYPPLKQKNNKTKETNRQTDKKTRKCAYCLFCLLVWFCVFVCSITMYPGAK